MKLSGFIVVVCAFILFFCCAPFLRPACSSDVAGPDYSRQRTVEIADLSSLPGRGERKDAGPLRNERERLYFDIYWMGIYVGNATLDEVKEGGKVTITSEVRSAPVISALYKVEDHAQSTMVDGKPLNFRIRQREGRYRSNKETLFDPADGKIIYFDYRKGLKVEHKAEKEPVWDVISGFYHLRTLLLETGKTLSLNVFDSNKMLKTEVHVLRKEKVPFPGRGEVEAFVVKPVLRTDGLFKHKGDILIWITKDDGRVPVKVETRVAVGKVDAVLKRIEISR